MVWVIAAVMVALAYLATGWAFAYLAERDRLALRATCTSPEWQCARHGHTTETGTRLIVTWPVLLAVKGFAATVSAVDRVAASPTAAAERSLRKMPVLVAKPESSGSDPQDTTALPTRFLMDRDGDAWFHDGQGWTWLRPELARPAAGQRDFISRNIADVEEHHGPLSTRLSPKARAVVDKYLDHLKEEGES